MVYKFKIYVKDDLDSFIYSPKLEKENTESIWKGMFISPFYIILYLPFENRLIQKFKKCISVKCYQL